MKRSQAFFFMHLAALLWGFTGVIGALITVDSSLIAAGRAIFALAAIVVWFGLDAVRDAINLPTKVRLLTISTGILLGIHWIFFFLAIRKGGVAIALVTYAAGAACTAVCEVILKLAPAHYKKFGAAFLSFVGIYCIHPITSVAALQNEGLIYGMISSIAISAMALLGKKLLVTQKISSLALTIGQLSGVAIITFPIAVMHVPGTITVRDIFLIAVLGILCSAVGQTLFNKALTVVSAGSASVIANMEAPYGVLLAAFLINQPITAGTASGVLFVTASAILVSVPSKETTVKKFQ